MLENFLSALVIVFIFGFVQDRYYSGSNPHRPESFALFISAFLVGCGIVEFCLRPFWPGKEVEKERRLKDAFENPDPTPSSDLPLEFRFISRQTSLQEVMDRVGPRSRKLQRNSVVAYEYDLPRGCAVLIFPEPPCRPESKVLNVRMYLKTEEDSLD